MAELVQIQDSSSIFIGWYGACGQNGNNCQDFPLTSVAIRSKISKVYQTSKLPNNDGYVSFDGTIDASYDNSLQAFTKLECGKSYIIVLKPGIGSLTIDGFTFTDQNTKDAGYITENCNQQTSNPTPSPVAVNPTPTPVLPTPTPKPNSECDCAPSNYTKVTTIGASFNSDNHTFMGFDNGVVISYDPSTFTDSLATMISFNYPGGKFAGMITLTAVKPSNTEFHIRNGNTCFTAIANSSNENDGSWDLELVQSKKLNNTCGDDPDLSTPSPIAVTPTPNPTPSPEDTEPKLCCPENYVKSTTTGNSSEITVVNIDVGGTLIGYYVHQAFDSNGTLCFDTSTPTSEVLIDDTSENYYYSFDGVNPIGVVNKKIISDANKFYYTNSSGECYEGNFNESGKNLSTPNVLNKIDGVGGPVPTPTPVKTPTPTPNKTPTPTPNKTPTPTPLRPKELEFRWADVLVNGLGVQSVLQVKNIIKPTNESFETRDVENNWSTLYGYTGVDSNYRLAHPAWPDASVSSDYDNFYTLPFTYEGMTFELDVSDTDVVDSSIQYKQLKVSLSDSQEFSHGSSEISPSNLYIYIGDNEDSDSAATGASSVWPVIMKKLNPTPTPADFNCCENLSETIDIEPGIYKDKNYVSVTGTEGTLCMEKIEESGNSFATAISFGEDGLSQGQGLAISGEGNYTGQVFRFVRASDGKCFGGNFDTSVSVNVWSEMN